MCECFWRRIGGARSILPIKMQSPQDQDLPSATGLPPPSLSQPPWALAEQASHKLAVLPALAAGGCESYADSLVAFCSRLRAIAIESRGGITDGHELVAGTALHFLVSLVDEGVHASAEVAVEATAAVEALVAVSARARELVVAGGLPSLVQRVEAGGTARIFATSTLAHLAMRSTDTLQLLAGCPRLFECMRERLEAAASGVESSRGIASIRAAVTLHALATAPKGDAMGGDVQAGGATGGDAGYSRLSFGRRSFPSSALSSSTAMMKRSRSVSATTCMQLLGDGKRGGGRPSSVVPCLIRLITTDTPDPAYGRLLVSLLDFGADVQSGYSQSADRFRWAVELADAVSDAPDLLLGAGESHALSDRGGEPPTSASPLTREERRKGLYLELELKERLHAELYAHSLLRIRRASEGEDANHQLLEASISFARWLGVEGSVFGAARAKLKEGKKLEAKLRANEERAARMAQANGTATKEAIRAKGARQKKLPMPNRGAHRGKPSAATRHLPVYLQDRTESTPASPRPSPRPTSQPVSQVKLKLGGLPPVTTPAAHPPRTAAAAASGNSIGAANKWWSKLRKLSQTAQVASAFQQAAAPEAANEGEPRGEHEAERRTGGFAALLMRGRYGAFGQKAFAWLSGKFDLLGGGKRGKREDSHQRSAAGDSVLEA